MLLKASNCCKYLHMLTEKEYCVNSTAAFMKANLFVITTRYEFYGSFSKTSYLIWMAVTTKAVRLSVMHSIHDCFTTCWIWSKQTWSSRHWLCETHSNSRNWSLHLFLCVFKDYSFSKKPFPNPHGGNLQGQQSWRPAIQPCSFISDQYKFSIPFQSDTYSTVDSRCFWV